MNTYVAVPISSDTWFHHDHIYVTVPSGQAPALPFQSRRILSALRTVNLPHYHISSSARYHLPKSTFRESSHSLTLPFIVLMHSNQLIFLPTLGKRVTPSCATSALGSNCFMSQPTKPQWQDASSSSSLNFLGRVLGRGLCSCSYCPSAKPGVRIPRLWNWRIRC